MKSVTLGATGLQVAPLVFGTLPLGPLQAQLSPTDGGSLIRHAVEAGITMVDTADLYNTFSHIRTGLAGFAGDVVIATKTHAADGPTARLHVEKALRDLARERVDIVHVHGARIADPFTERAAVIEELLNLKEEGKIGHVGLSSHYISAFVKAASHPEIEVIHPLINRTGMGILDGTAAKMAAAVAACARAGKGIYAMKALAGGNLISSARESFRFVRSIEGIHGIAVGMLSRQEIDANIALFTDDTAEDAQWEVLESRRRRLAIMDNFCKGCGNCLPACTNDALTIVDGKAKVDDETCILCGYCAASCPEFIIRVV